MATPQTAADDSRGPARRPRGSGRRFSDSIRDSGPLGWVLLTLGFAGGLAMIVSEFMTLSSFDIGITSCTNALDVTNEPRFSKLCTTSGHQHHHYALLALGLLTLVLAFGAAVGRSRPAALALGVVGLAVVVIAIAYDHPSFDKTRGLELLFPPGQIRGKSGTGYNVELAAGVLAIAAGGLGLLRRPAEETRPRPERPVSPSTA